MEVKKREIEERQDLSRRTKLNDRIIHHDLWQTRLEIAENIKSLPNLSTDILSRSTSDYFCDLLASFYFVLLAQINEHDELMQVQNIQLFSDL